MAWIPPATIGDEYNQWNDERGENDPRFLGTVTGRSTPAYYHPERHRVERGDIDDRGELVRDSDGESWTLEAEEELGEFLERVGEEHGWDSLSSFAREHLENEEQSA